MALKALIDKQKIIIDDHKRGSREVKNWDDKTADVHIDKSTNFPVNGERQDIRIRVPINSDRPIIIENAKKKKLKEIPSQLKREIQRAFEDKQGRESFIKDIIEHIKNFDTILSSEDRVRQVLSNISKHFGLDWNNEIIATYTDDILSLYTQNYTDDNGRQYFITVDKEKIQIGENNGYVRHQRHIKRK
ncbi:hypothetical protein [Chlorobium ferrooxidans]|uniref:hypothetical protein n=1 Tax=Chlorobium ferrooxidans TaxID=84205 RepID=UPI00058F4BDD|nr:hypothetical protein [Chlorobium ferrooxidans]